MVPSGRSPRSRSTSLRRCCSKGDIIIDGGNSQLHGLACAARTSWRERGIDFVDAGTSGGIWGLKDGYCLMVGGADEAFAHARAGADDARAAPTATRTCGPAGAGHFVKMVHNGIEYGMMQAYAEGFEIMHAIDVRARPARDRHALAAGHVVRSWLLELLETRLRATTRASTSISGYVEDSGEGRWTVEAGDRPGRARAGHHAVAHAPLALRGRTTRSARRSARRCATSSAATR